MSERGVPLLRAHFVTERCVLQLGALALRFARDLTTTQADVERAETLLKRDGLIPVEDDSGHRGGACQSRRFPSWSDAAVDSAQTPNRSSRSSAARRHSTSTGQRLHHLTAIARWAASSAVHSSRVMGSLQRGRSPAAARDRSARLSPSVAVIGWPALGVRRHGRFRGVNTFRRRRRFNVAAPKAGGKSPGAVCVDRTCKWGHRFGLAWPPHGGELILEAVGPAGPVTQPLVKVLGSSFRSRRI
jgi:hypothetical protein